MADAVHTKCVKKAFITEPWASAVPSVSTDLSSLAFPHDNGTSVHVLGDRRASSSLPDSILKSPIGDGGPLAFNPHLCSSNILAISEGLKLRIVDITAPIGEECISNHMHARAVNAVSWHNEEPHVCASASLDSHIRVWDTRHDFKTPHRGQLTFTTPLCQCAHIAWSYSSHILASAHGSVVTVFDRRQQNVPLHTLHCATNIQSFDFCIHDTACIATVSDAAAATVIKLWSLETPKAALFDVVIESPSVHITFAPFGPVLLVSAQSSMTFLDVRCVAEESSRVREPTVVELIETPHRAAISAVGKGMIGSAHVLWSYCGYEHTMAQYQTKLPSDFADSVIQLPTGLSTLSSVRENESGVSVQNGCKTVEPSLKYILDVTAHLEGLVVQAQTSKMRTLHEDTYEIKVEISENDIHCFVIALATDDPEAPLKVHMEAHQEWKHCVTEGVVETFFDGLKVHHLKYTDDDECFVAKVKSLIDYFRCDLPPDDADVFVENELEPASPAENMVPFPPTSGGCWTPHGELYRFESLLNLKLKRTRLWTHDDYLKILELKTEKGVKMLLHISEAQEGMADIRDVVAKVETNFLVQILDFSNTLAASESRCYVEDNWWVVAGERFSVEGRSRDICEENAKICMEFGREDLAKVWSVIQYIVSKPYHRETGHISVDIALIEHMLKDLFAASETQTIALIGIVLLNHSYENDIPDPNRSFRRKSSIIRSEDLSQKAESFDFANYNMQTWPRGAAVPANLHGPVPSLTSPTLTSPKGDPKIVWHKMELEKVNLFPRETNALGILVQSAHAHCDLFLSISQFVKSRLLAKLLYLLRTRHFLPLLATEQSSGKFFTFTREDTIDIPTLPLSSSAPASIVNERDGAQYQDLSRAATEFNGMRVDTSSTGSRVYPACSLCRAEVRTLFVCCPKCAHGGHRRHMQQWFGALTHPSFKERAEHQTAQIADADDGPMCPWPTCQCRCSVF